MKLSTHTWKFLVSVAFLCFAALLVGPLSSGQEGGWRVVRADYGFRDQRTDVTDILRDLISRGGVNGRVAVNNQTMGGDPAVGRDKTLRIFARNANGEDREFDIREGGSVDVRYFDVSGRDRDDHDRDRDRDHDHDRDRDHDRGRLIIVRAYYGVQGHAVNVTDRLQSMVRDGGLEVRVNNDTFGGDPAVGAQKVLIVIYNYRGQEQATAVWEGNRLQIP